MRLCALFGVLLATLGLVCSPVSAEIVSHKAIYKISLLRSTPAGSIQGMSGEMTMQVANMCDGLAVAQYLQTDFWEQDGVLRMGELTASSWEALDGLSMRFTLANRIDNSLVEAYEGEAKRPAAGGAGTIVYKDNDYPSADLPADVIFPRQHLDALLKAAETGKRTYIAQVFDGAEDGKVFNTTAIIGPARQGGEELPSGTGLEEMSYWPVSLSYFPVSSQEALPEYETSFHLYANGVSTDLVMDYGDFAMKGRLESLVTTAPPDCK